MSALRPDQFVTHDYAGDLSNDQLLAMLENMMLSRKLDERMWVLNRQGKVPFHISAMGHEACQVGMAFAMRPGCLLYTSPSPRDRTRSRMPSSA